jgi:hypothetical protein
VFPMRYELSSYILITTYSVFKGLIKFLLFECKTGTRYPSRYSDGLDGQDSIPGIGKDVYIIHSAQTVDLTQPHMQQVPEVKSREADHLHLVPRSRMVKLSPLPTMPLHVVELN